MKFFNSWTVHKIIEYLTLKLCVASEISITQQHLTFLTHPVYSLVWEEAVPLYRKTSNFWSVFRGHI